MAFDKYKAKHGGTGPFEQFYDSVTGGEGLFGYKGIKEERSLTDKLIADIQGNKELESLSAVAESGRAPMTREQHALFRSGMLQAAMDQKQLSENYDQFNERLGQLRGHAPGQENQDVLDTLESAGKYAYSLVHSGNPEHRQEGLQKMGEAFSGLHSFATAHQTQQLQAQAVQDGRRDTARNELQDLLDNSAIALGVQDKIEYEGIQSQLTDKDPKANATPAVIASALQYQGSNARLAEDGHWSFSFNGVGYQDQDVPTMTNSQVADVIRRAHDGRQQTIQGFATDVANRGKAKGFGLNGSNVEDLVFPLGYTSDKAAPVFDPAAPAPEHIEKAAQNAVTTLENLAEGVTRGVAGDFTADLLFNTEMPGSEFIRRLINGEQLFPSASAAESKPTSAAERARARGEPSRLPTNSVGQQ